MFAAILPVAANGAIYLNARPQVPTIIVPHSILMDDILVWGPLVSNAPMTDLLPEGSVDRSIVTQNL